MPSSTIQKCVLFKICIVICINNKGNQVHYNECRNVTIRAKPVFNTERTMNCTITLGWHINYFILKQGWIHGYFSLKRWAGTLFEVTRAFGQE